MGIALLLHVLAVVIWVGGMFFAYIVLRPAAAGLLQPPQRLALWAGVFSRFFPWVIASVVVILCSGLWMVLSVFGGFGVVGIHIHLMFALGLIMMAIFFYLFFGSYRQLRAAVERMDWQEGGRQLARIRVLVGVNLSLGLLVIAVASGGRFLVV